MIANYLSIAWNVLSALSERNDVIYGNRFGGSVSPSVPCLSTDIANKGFRFFEHLVGTFPNCVMSGTKLFGVIFVFTPMYFAGVRNSILRFLDGIWIAVGSYSEIVSFAISRGPLVSFTVGELTGLGPLFPPKLEGVPITFPSCVMYGTESLGVVDTCAIIY